MGSAELLQRIRQRKEREMEEAEGPAGPGGSQTERASDLVARMVQFLEGRHAGATSQEVVEEFGHLAQGQPHLVKQCLKQVAELVGPPGRRRWRLKASFS